jgi:uncharacterized protein (UPF0335 family)
VSRGGGTLSPVAADRLERFFDKVERMTDAEFALMRAIWDDADETNRVLAWRHVRRILKHRKLDSALDDAQARLAAWVNNYMSARIANTWMGTSGMDSGDIRQIALPPLMDAVAAIITSSDLDAGEQTFLLEPIARLARHPQPR